MSERVTLGGRALPEGQGEKLGDPGGAWSREEPVEVAWASGQDASWTPAWGGVSGMPDYEEAPGQNQALAK